MEALRDNFDQVVDRTHYEVPANVLESADFNAFKLGHKPSTTPATRSDGSPSPTVAIDGGKSAWPQARGKAAAAPGI